MECYGASDIGKRRKENQDTFVIKSIDNCTVAVVCDGMGGAAGGLLASRIASDRFVQVFSMQFEEFCSQGGVTVASVGIPRAIKNAVKAANKEVYEKSLTDKELQGMGTTLVGAVFFDGVCYAVNVGDSRMYQYDFDFGMQQITKDHTYIEFLIEHGTKITKSIEKHEKGVITRALGPDEKVVPDTYVFPYTDGEMYLLCSDGLYNMIGDDGIIKALSSADQSSLEQVCTELIENANHAGGKDNITAVIIKV